MAEAVGGRDFFGRIGLYGLYAALNRSLDYERSVRLARVFTLSGPPMPSVRAWRVSLASPDGLLRSPFAARVEHDDGPPSPEHIPALEPHTEAVCSKPDNHDVPASGCGCGVRACVDLKPLRYHASRLDELLAGRRLTHKEIAPWYSGRTPVLHSVEMRRAWANDTSCLLEPDIQEMIVRITGGVAPARKAIALLLDWPSTVRASAMLLNGPAYMPEGASQDVADAVARTYDLPVRVIEGASTAAELLDWAMAEQAAGHDPGAPMPASVSGH